MRKFLVLFLAALLCVAPAAAISHRKFNQLQIQQNRAMHEIVMVERDETGEIVDGGLCTAYAVGPHTLLTAEHCNTAKVDTVYVDPMDKESVKKDQARKYKIVSRIFDNEDHMLLDLKGINFSATIYLPPNVRLPEQGEHIYFWGNPAGIKDQYREGVVMGDFPYNLADGDVNAVGPFLYTAQVTTIGGDSGSAVFSAKDGALIGIVTYGINNGTVMGMFPIRFTGAQIEKSLE